MTSNLNPAQLNFAEFVRPDDNVCWGQAAAEPLTLTEKLMQQRHEIGHFNAFIGIGWSATPDPAYCDAVSFSSYCGTGTNRHLVAKGKLDILPVHYSSLSEYLTRRIDVLLLQLAPSKNKGKYSFGLACEYLQPLVSSARIVIAEINDQAPTTSSDHIISHDDIDVLIHTSRSIPDGPIIKQTEVNERIGTHVASLIEDGATLQIGLGEIPSAILGKLSNHRNLGVHSGLLDDGIGALISSGVITNSMKGIDEGISVCGMIAGNKFTRELCHGNNEVRLAATSYTHAQSVLERLKCFTAINSAVEVDLSGQINAEVAAGRYVGAVGGAADFLRGAQRSTGGLPIVAIGSSLTTRSGNKISRIVSRLSGPASTSRSDAGFIVTEHGVADLRGATIVQRVKRMIQIADPAHKEYLEREAYDLF